MAVLAGVCRGWLCPPVTNPSKTCYASPVLRHRRAHRPCSIPRRDSRDQGAERAIRGKETMHVGTLGVPIKGSVKVPRSDDRGAQRSEYDEEAELCRSSRSNHAASFVKQDRRARPTHRSGNSTTTLRKGSSMKLSRRSDRCQRNQAISRMSLCVYLMQPLNRSALLSDIGMTPALKHARSGKLNPVPHHPDTGTRP